MIVRITLTDPTGCDRVIEHPAGSSVMEAAVENEVPGIEAQCYGAAVCGTCHVYVAPEYFDATGERSDWEIDMLDALPLARPNSRLACQIPLTEAIDGAVFIAPERQDARA